MQGPELQGREKLERKMRSPEVQGRRQLRRREQQLWLRIRWRRLLCEICQGRKGPNSLLQTVPADSIKVTAAVKMSKKPTARSANARTRTTRKIKTVKENAVSRSTRATATATTRNLSRAE